MKETIRKKLVRVPILIVGMFTLAFGIALSTKSGLGVDPGASAVYLLGEITPLTMGTFTIMMHILYILIQVVLLRRDFHPSRLLQLIPALAFSYFLDFALKILSPLQVSGYPKRLLVCLLSCAIMGLGVYLEIHANVIVMASEGALSTIAAKVQKDFGIIKIFNDLTCVIISAVLSLAAYHEIRAIREGTVIAALLVGLFTQLYGRIHTAILKPKALPELITDRETMLRKEYPLVVTIEREYFSGGSDIGRALADALGIKFYDDELIAKAAEETGLPFDKVVRNEEQINSLLYLFYNQTHAYTQEQSTQDAIFEAQKTIIRRLANESCVIVGRLGGYFLKDRPNTLHVFISAQKEFRAARLASQSGMSGKRAVTIISKVDRLRNSYCRHYTGASYGQARDYRLCLDSSAYGFDKTTHLIQEALKDFHAEAISAE